MSLMRRGESVRARFWRELITDWERSGQTQAAFCQARGVRQGTLAWWRRQLRRASVGATSQRERVGTRAAGFIEMPLTTFPARPAYEIVLSGGRIVRVPEDFEAEAVSRLVRAVEAAC